MTYRMKLWLLALWVSLWKTRVQKGIDVLTVTWYNRIFVSSPAATCYRRIKTCYFPGVIILFCPTFMLLLDWKILKSLSHWGISTLRSKQYGWLFVDDILECIVLTENMRVLIEIPLKFALKGAIDNKSALVQVWSWCRSGDMPLPGTMLT